MTKKLSKIETEAWVSLVMATEELLKKIEAELKNNGLPPFAWYDVLLELDKSHDGRLRFVELGNRVLLKRYNVTRIIKRLELDGLAKRENCNEDARGIFAVITKKGRKVREKMWPVYYNVVKEHFLSNFNKKELDDFLGHLKKIRNGIRA
ncbi:MAG: MarR family winged helix-turn-helix transcriptional regulator [Thermodesulfobacteriota bacterium]